MYYSNINFTVVYVDPSAATAGDGTTPAKALKALPTTVANFTEGTCYLIRRTAETSAVTLPMGTNSTITNMILLGMPKVTDSLYELIPAEAKTAWGNDAAEYANVLVNTASGSSGTSCTLSAIKNFLLHRVYLFRDNTNANCAALNFSGTSYTSCISIENCKFGAKGIDIDRPDWSTQVTTGYCKAYIQVKYARIFSMRNCLINHVCVSSGYGGGSAHSVSLENAHFVSVSNIEVNVTTSQYGASGPSGMVGTPFQMYTAPSSGASSMPGSYSSYENITFNILLNGTYEYLPKLFFASGCNHIRLCGIRAETVRQLGSAPGRLVLGQPLIQCTANREFRVEGVIINIPECWAIESAGRAFSFTGSSAGPGMTGNTIPGYERLIKAINVTLADNNGLDSTKNGNYYEQSKTSDNLNYYSALELDFGSQYYYGAYEPVIAEDIIVSHPRGIAFYGNGMQLSNCRIKGTMRCLNMIADIESLETYYPGYAIWAKSGSTIRIRKLTLGKSNAEAVGGDVNDPAIGSLYSDYGFVYVDESNAPLRDNLTYATDVNNMFGVVCGSESDPGHFTHRSQNCICDTWNVHRSGGATACLKIWNNSFNTTSDLSLGRVPFKGVQLVPEATGKHLLKVHVATKAMTNLADLYQRLIIQVTVPNEDGTTSIYFSPTGGSWQPDPTSSWINDSDLDQFVLTIPIIVTCLSPIDLKIHFNWYSQAGFVYVDPAFSLTAV